ncbi:cellulose biosynthesis protein BcsS [Methylobacterium planeticum]|uniref:Cellulose biosynthesis protein BcsS n=1 Tax=Methylobacterium planeticum TaxID=2615211 RepID=A0A6N6MXD1_9HYPH|nr:cellulose biosynthesis protein BcsS [Methylobacterium planeticum]KAB1073779.1 cellulose biosynthesis protein BcsS [Methylobacterium planeticum]
MSLALALLWAGSACGADWYTGTERADRADDYIVAFDGAATVTSNSSAFGALTTTIAPAGSLVESGPRIRVQAIAGTYSYPGATAGTRVRGEQEEGTVLTGYEWIWDQAAIAGYVGFNVRHNELSILDPRNPVVGTGIGAKVAADIYLNPTLNTLVAANASYSTLFNAYYVRAKLGFMVADGVFVGPEGTLLGDAFFNQWRVGAHLTGFTVGPMKFSLGAGYAYDRVQKGGYYTSVEGRAAF